MFGAGDDQLADDRSIDVKEIIAGHSRLPGDAGGDDNDVGAVKGVATGDMGIGKDGIIGVAELPEGGGIFEVAIGD